MNMKKTLAVVSAATLAISAMATTIAAADAGSSYTYSLVEKKEITTKGTAVVKAANFDNVDITRIAFDKDELKYDGGDFTITFKGTVLDATSSEKTTIDETYTNKKDAEDGFEAGVEFIFDKAGWIPDFLRAKAGTAQNTFTGSVSISYTHEYDGVKEYNAGTEGEDGKFVMVYDANGAVTDYAAWETAKFPTSGTLYDAAVAEFATKLEKDLKANVKAPTKSIEEYPYQTGYNSTSEDESDDNKDNNTGYGDIISYLEYWNVVDKDNSYDNVMPVLNDILANYNDVTLTFNTATKKVMDSTKDNSGKYSDDGNDKYLKFDQGTFNLFGDENTGNLGLANFNWAGSNLHQAGLIVNNQYTMAYSEILSYDYAGTALTFDLAGTIANTPYGNTFYTQYVQNLQLATTNEWYWDSMTVTYANVEESEVGAGEGLEENEETLPEVDLEVETITEPVVEETTVVEEVPVAPTTGNAPIALAVIPVALAAAAIVAKKRK